MTITPLVRTTRLVVLFATLLSLATGSAVPLISEFVADNETGLRDSYNEYSDWLELFNPTPVATSLDGYFLTDDEADLTQWQIPSGTTLDPFGFLVIFASGKNDTNPAEELHTNFKISASGEYLALVAPDGVTIISEFSPSFPAQFANSSYGVELTATTIEEILFDANAACSVHIPSDELLGDTWKLPAFDDTTWTFGSAGVGYERGATLDSLISLDIEAAMYSQNSSAYIRIPFEVIEPETILELDLEIQFDDAFSASLNGTRVAGSNSAFNPAWNATASVDRPDVDALDFQSYSLDQYIGLLHDPELLFAIHGLSTAPADDNFVIRPRLVGTRITAATVGPPAYFLSPTPGTLNGLEQNLPTSEVLFSETSRTFTTQIDITLSSTFGEEIRYTLDGSVPSPASDLYAGPIPLTVSTQIRARVYSEAGAAGPLAMETYLHLAADLTNFSSNLPILVLENWGAGKPGTNSNTPGFWAIIEPDATTNNRAEMLDPLQLATRCGMRVRGSSSAGFPKYSLSLESQDEAGDDLGVRPLGMPKESDWVLSGRYTFDRALMRNPLIYQLSNETGEYAVRTRFVEVINNTGGGDLSYADDYFGVYTLMEKIKRDDDRVPVASIGRRDSREPAVTGGYMFKKDRLDPGDSGLSVNGMGTLGWVEPKEEDVNSSQASWLQGHLNEVNTALYDPSWTNPTTGKHFTDYLDSYSWLRHHWLNTLAMNVDGFRLSGYYYKHRSDTNDGKVGAGPIWDFDRTMQSIDGRDDNPNAWDGAGDSSHTWSDGRFPWWGRALENPDFRQAHTDLWQELRQSTFSTANIDSIIDDFATQLDTDDPRGTNGRLLRSPAARNFKKWAAAPPRNGSHSAEVIILKDWLQQRTIWIDSQYTGQPEFTVSPGHVAPGTEVGLTATNTVYYTTNNTDPRLPGGGVSPDAVSGALPATISESTIITARARTRSGLTQWSGPVQATYLVGTLADYSNLVITEVHYAPLPPTTAEELAEATDASAFEFLELINTSPTDTIELTDVHFETGIDFTFTGSAITTLAPGERVLIVSDQSAFEARNGLAHSDRIAGEFAPSRLDNAGERIHLVNGVGTTIADFTYNDKSPWPSEAGFTGYSMVLRSFAIADPNYSSPSHWRSSGFLGGNPNSSDSSTLVGTPNDDDDQDGLDKLLEHALGSDDAIPNPPGSSFTTTVETLLVNGAINNYLTITYRRNLLADDVFLILQGSYDLRTWFGGDAEFPIVSEVNQGDGTTIITRRTADPYDPGTTPTIFLRLQAQSALTTSLIAWMAGLNITDPQAPFESSSLSNLMAYAVGADLTPTPAEALPVLSIVNDAGVDYPALSFRSRLGADDISFTIEVSADLLNWQSGSAVTEIAPRQDNGDGTETVTVRSTQSTASGPIQSLRLRVTVN